MFQGNSHSKTPREDPAPLGNPAPALGFNRLLMGKVEGEIYFLGVFQ